jgi:hypothetical protein
MAFSNTLTRKEMEVFGFAGFDPVDIRNASVRIV